MFTGIIEEIGRVKKISWGKSSARISIAATLVVSDVKIGDSINTNGVCLTVTAFTAKGFEVDVVAETMRRTNLKELITGSLVNLERALRLSDRLGGHMVSGHIDGTALIASVEKEDNAIWFKIKTGPEILKYIVQKGSVTLDGISLTVAGIDQRFFRVSIIPHTGERTTLLNKKTGDMINIENDITAKYIEKFLGGNHDNNKSKINLEYLGEHGFID